MKPWIKRQWQGLGAIILPFHPPTRLHILSAFSSWRILLPQFLVCRRVNYNPIQAPQTPRPGENWYRWLRIESCPIGKTCRQRSGWLAPHGGQKRTPCNFPVAPFDTLETSQSRWGPAQPLRLESILSPKLSHCLILPQTQSGLTKFGDQLKSDPVHRVVWQGKFSNVVYFYYVESSSQLILFFLPLIDRWLLQHTCYVSLTCFLRLPLSQHILDRIACMKQIDQICFSKIYSHFLTLKNGVEMKP